MIDGTLLLAIPIAVLAGLVSFLSPCVLPLVPGYLSYAAGMASTSIGSSRDRLRILLGSILFVLGFTLIFVSYGSIFGGLGAFLSRHQRTFEIILGLLTIIMGLLFSGVITQYRQWKIPFKAKGGIAGAPLLGVLFGLGWTPCLGPVISTIIGLAMTQGSSGRGAVLAAAYSAGIGLPFILFGQLLQTAHDRLRFFRRHARFLSWFGGGLLILIGLSEVTGLWNDFTIQLRGMITEFQPVL